MKTKICSSKELKTKINKKIQNENQTMLIQKLKMKSKLIKKHQNKSNECDQVRIQKTYHNIDHV